MTGTAELNLTADDMRNVRLALEYCYDNEWDDGLPVVPPVEEFVDSFLEHTTRDPSEVLCVADHLDRQCTVHSVAVSGVMAGCKPEYMPLLVALAEGFQDIGPVMAQSTTGRAFAVIVNGPIRDRIGINSGTDVFGPGSRANATIGRALRLILYNVFGIRPHDLDQSTQGTPGKFSLCIGEHEESSPWAPLHVEHGFNPDASTVTIQQVRGSLHVDLRTTQVPEEILYTIARSMSYPGWTARSEVAAGGNVRQTDGLLHKNLSCLVVLGPEHAGHIARRGWSKSDVRRFLWERWGNTAGELRLCGQPPDIAGIEDDAFIHAAPTPDTITIVVAGADNAGVSTVLPSPGRRLGGPKLIDDV